MPNVMVAIVNLLFCGYVSSIDCLHHLRMECPHGVTNLIKTKIMRKKFVEIFKLKRSTNFLSNNSHIIDLLMLYPYKCQKTVYDLHTDEFSSFRNVSSVTDLLSN